MREHNTAGRPREFDESDALIKMMNLFWEKGFEGVSLADIMKATDLKKGSLYAAFTDKRNMYLQAIAHYESLIVDSAVRALKTSDDPLSRLNVFMSSPIESVRKNGDRRGCFLCNAAADQSALDPETSKLVCRGYKKLENALKHSLRDALPNETLQIINSRALVLLSIYSGLRVMARSGIPIKDLNTLKNHALSLVVNEMNENA